MQLGKSHDFERVFTLEACACGRQCFGGVAFYGILKPFYACQVNFISLRTGEPVCIMMSSQRMPQSFLAHGL